MLFNYNFEKKLKAVLLKVLTMIKKHNSFAPQVTIVAASGDKMRNKKVLLRERKRHTARLVVSACYAALSNRGYPIQSWLGWYPVQSSLERYPIQSLWGVPHPVMVGGTPSSHGGGGYSIQSWWGYPEVPPLHPDLGQTPPHPDLG